MRTSNKAIVLSKIKYRDNDLIVKCYTEKRGVVSYLVKNAFKKKNTVAYFQLLSQLLIEENYRNNQNLHYISEVKLNNTYSTLHSNVLKSSIVIFLTEVLSIILKEEEQNQDLYDFLENALLWLDNDNQFANFHILFLLKLTKHLGFYPEESVNNHFIFNLETGQFEKDLNKHSLSVKNNDILKHLLGMKFDGLNTLKLNANQRQSFLNALLLYFELHLGNFKKPKSLLVLNQVFN
ncbi:DNA repair protein RecO [Hanstruepera marina]|uniref:DNA repair protein RecO n=1 Tax=Hanstruepera marina TaxID=2873265 RepID=UPI001CA678BA|nr:DNA repair protein RecO [Hanstruepera marina]